MPKNTTLWGNSNGQKWATLVKTKAANERAVQIRYIKMVWLNAASPHSLANNALESDTHTEEYHNIELTPRVLNSGITTVQQLRELIKSPAMYRNAEVFDLFSSGLESGMLKLARQKSPAPLRKLITIAHEAHFRLELWLALSKQGFRHKTTNAWHDKRKKYWNEFCKLVAQDRKEN